MAAKATTSVLPAAKALLLVLVGLVAAHAQVANKADPMGVMRRSLLTSSAGSICTAEATDCIGDESCVDCFTVLSEGMSSCNMDEVNSDCGDLQDYFCCTLEEEGEECTSNSAFANYFECVVDYSSAEVCASGAVDLSDCNGATGRASSRGLSFLAGSGAVAGVLVAIFGFAV